METFISQNIQTIIPPKVEASYSEISITFYYDEDLSPRATSVRPVFSYSQTKTYANGETEKLTSGATVTFTGLYVNTSTGAVSGSSLEAVETSRTLYDTVTVNVSMNGKTARKTATVYREANKGTRELYAILNYTDIPSSGGSSSPIWKSFYWQTVYTSGATANKVNANMSEFDTYSYSLNTNPLPNQLTIDATSGVVTLQEPIEITSNKQYRVQFMWQKNDVDSKVHYVYSTGSPKITV